MGLPTFKVARQNILGELQRSGWTVRAGLKVPHATSPSGRVRLWFKPQSVHYSEGVIHTLGYARSLTDREIDIREVSPARFVALVRGAFGAAL